MCIICNCGDVGDEFLSAFEEARRGMKKAKEAMGKCAKMSNDKVAAKTYDATHKKMARLIREWNRLEQFRERGHEG